MCFEIKSRMKKIESINKKMSEIDWLIFGNYTTAVENLDFLLDETRAGSAEEYCRIYCVH